MKFIRPNRIPHINFKMKSVTHTTFGHCCPNAKSKKNWKDNEQQNKELEIKKKYDMRYEQQEKSILKQNEI